MLFEFPLNRVPHGRSQSSSWAGPPCARAHRPVGRHGGPRLHAAGPADEDPPEGSRRLRPVPGADGLRSGGPPGRPRLREAHDEPLPHGVDEPHRPDVHERHVRALRRARVGLDARRERPGGVRCRAQRPVLAHPGRRQRCPGGDGAPIRDHVHHLRPQDVAVLRAGAGLGALLRQQSPHRPHPLQLQLQRCGRTDLVVDRRRGDHGPDLVAAVLGNGDHPVDADRALLRHAVRGGPSAAGPARQPADDGLLRVDDEGAGHRVPALRGPAADRGGGPQDAGDPREAWLAHRLGRVPDVVLRHDLDRRADPPGQAGQPADDGLLRVDDEGAGHRATCRRRATTGR